jgi:hypothetical protein
MSGWLLHVIDDLLRIYTILLGILFSTLCGEGSRKAFRKDEDNSYVHDLRTMMPEVARACSANPHLITPSWGKSARIERASAFASSPPSESVCRNNYTTLSICFSMP